MWPEALRTEAEVVEVDSRSHNSDDVNLELSEALTKAQMAAGAGCTGSRRLRRCKPHNGALRRGRDPRRVNPVRLATNRTAVVADSTPGIESSTSSRRLRPGPSLTIPYWALPVTSRCRRNWRSANFDSSLCERRVSASSDNRDAP